MKMKSQPAVYYKGAVHLLYCEFPPSML